MSKDEILTWMCKEMTYWYIETDEKKEILYPINKEKQKIVQNILVEDADIIIYEKRFYSLEKDVAKTINKTSYTYYMKESTTYKKRKAISILPYSLKDSKLTIIKKMLFYYKKYNHPFLLVAVDNYSCLKPVLTNILNPFTYINLNSKKILFHKDICASLDNTTVILMTDINQEKLNKKYLKLKKEINKSMVKNKKNIKDYDNIIVLLSKF